MIFGDSTDRNSWDLSFLDSPDSQRVAGRGATKRSCRNIGTTCQIIQSNRGLFAVEGLGDEDCRTERQTPTEHEKVDRKSQNYENKISGLTGTIRVSDSFTGDDASRKLKSRYLVLRRDAQIKSEVGTIFSQTLDNSCNDRISALSEKLDTHCQFFSEQSPHCIGVVEGNLGSSASEISSHIYVNCLEEEKTNECNSAQPKDVLEHNVTLRSEPEAGGSAFQFCRFEEHQQEQHNNSHYKLSFSDTPLNTLRENSNTFRQMNLGTNVNISNSVTGANSDAKSNYKMLKISANNNELLHSENQSIVNDDKLKIHPSENQSSVDDDKINDSESVLSSWLSSSSSLSSDSTFSLCSSRSLQLPQTFDQVTLVPSDDATEEKYPTYSRSVPSLFDWEVKILETTYSRLSLCQFYFQGMNLEESGRHLAGFPVGMFLLRDSSDPRFIFSLSIMTNRGVTSIRIAFSSGKFRLDCDDHQIPIMPTFDCVLSLIRHYIVLSRDTQRRIKTNSKIQYLFLERSGRQDTPVLMLKPVRVEPITLLHMCRLRVNGLLRGQSVDRLCLSPSLKKYLNDYPYDF